jgi:hypothetical protein
VSFHQCSVYVAVNRAADELSLGTGIKSHAVREKWTEKCCQGHKVTGIDTICRQHR